MPPSTSPELPELARSRILHPPTCVEVDLLRTWNKMTCTAMCVRTREPTPAASPLLNHTLSALSMALALEGGSEEATPLPFRASST